MIMLSTPWPVLALCSLAAPTFAQGNGMDMSMDTPIGLTVGRMLRYAHFTPGDTLWCLGWTPTSPGAMVGACLALFLLALFERWLAASLDFAERHWAERASVMCETPGGGSALPSPSSARLRLRLNHNLKCLPSVPFVPEFDLTRGVLFAAHAFITFLLMMAVMYVVDGLPFAAGLRVFVARTFQLSYIASIVVGSGVGETLFGRFLSSHKH